MSARGPIGLIIRRSLRRDLFKRSKSSGRIAYLCNCNRSTNQRTDAGRSSHQALVEQRDFLPIDASGSRSISVNGLNGSFQLIVSHALERGSRMKMSLG